MSGGLRHLNDEGNGPSHAVGYKSSKKQDSYSLERNQCVCAVEEVCPDLQKPKPKSLDRTVVVRDVENRPSHKLALLLRLFGIDERYGDLTSTIPAAEYTFAAPEWTQCDGWALSASSIACFRSGCSANTCSMQSCNSFSLGPCSFWLSASKSRRTLDAFLPNGLS